MAILKKSFYKKIYNKNKKKYHNNKKSPNHFFLFSEYLQAKHIYHQMTPENISLSLFLLARYTNVAYGYIERVSNISFHPFDPP